MVNDSDQDKMVDGHSNHTFQNLLWFSLVAQISTVVGQQSIKSMLVWSPWKGIKESFFKQNAVNFSVDAVFKGD